MKKLVLLWLLLINSLVFADQLIIEPDMGREPILQLINQAKQTVDLTMYGLTDPDLLNALLKQHQRGRTVKIILEESPYKAIDENQQAIAAFDKYKINWQGNIPPYKLIHQKTLITDGDQALVMTFNFTRSTFKNDRNFALLIEDKATAKEIQQLFDADWNHVPYVPHSDRLIVSPDNSRNKLLDIIAHARTKMDIYEQSISDYQLIGALAKAAKRGVTINLLTSRPLSDKQSNYLTQAGVTIRQSKHRYIHAKALIIDNTEAIIGSINFTRPSLDDNRELAVISYDKEVIKQLSKTFKNDWESATETEAKRKQHAKTRLTQKEIRLLLKLLNT